MIPYYAPTHTKAAYTVAMHMCTPYISLTLIPYLFTPLIYNIYAMYIQANIFYTRVHRRQTLDQIVTNEVTYTASKL